MTAASKSGLMDKQPASKTGRSRSKTIRSVAIPTEHGGWGFLLEPIVLGLIVAPTFAGFCIGIAASGVFLLNHPLQLTVKDWLKRKRYPRTPYAERFSIGYGLTAGIAFVLALLTAIAPFWLPILIATPFALVQILASVRNKGRSFWAELSGASTLGATAAAMVLAAGGSLNLALAVWLVLITRAATSILYVRTRLRLEYGEPADHRAPIIAHVLAVAGWGLLAIKSLGPWLVALAMLILLVRASVGLSSLRKARRPQIIGFQELGYGLLVAILSGIGFR